MASRREFLKAVALTSLVATSGVSLWQLSLSDTQSFVEQDNYPYQFLTLDDRLVLFAIAPAMLGTAIDTKSPTKIIGLLQQIDQAIDFTSKTSADELRQLLDLLSNQLGRAYIAGVWTSWNKANQETLTSFLRDWRKSYLAILRSGYLGLHQLMMGTFYAQPENWQAIGYAGPPKMNLPDSFYEKFEL